MADTFTCPRCKSTLTLRPGGAGDFVTCPRCLAYVANPDYHGGRSALDRDLRLDQRGSSGLILVLAGLIVVGGFFLACAGLGGGQAQAGPLLIFGAAVAVPVVLGCVVLYFSGASGRFASMGPAAGTILLTLLLTGLVILSAVVVFFAVCVYAISR
jgi:hypothetical protein